MSRSTVGSRRTGGPGGGAHGKANFLIRLGLLQLLELLLLLVDIDLVFINEILLDLQLRSNDCLHQQLVVQFH